MGLYSSILGVNQGVAERIQH